METEKNNHYGNEVAVYLENISIVILSLLFLGFPLIFTTMATDPFVLPKQALLGAAVLLSLLFLGGKMLSEGKVVLRKTPYDLLLFFFGLATLFSAIFSLNRADSLIAFAPLAFGLLGFFTVVNLIKRREPVIFLTGALLLGGTVLSVLSLLSYLKIYIFPFAITKAQVFTPMGSLLDQAMYLAALLPVAILFALSDKKNYARSIAGAIFTAVIALGLLVSVYGFFFLQKSYILPLETGFQTAFAAISQDTGRIAQGFLFGSGFGTYFTDFTRFKQAAFNQNPILWALSFPHSSNLILELLATTGILGFASFVAIAIQAGKDALRNVLGEGIKTNPASIALLLILLATFLLPFGFANQTLLFFLLALFASYQAQADHKRFYDIELYFATRREGVFGFSTAPATEQLRTDRNLTRFLPVSFFVLFVIVVGLFGFFSVRYIASDVLFQNSFVAASQNNGLQTYNDQTKAIGLFPYRDGYYRIYSQLNLNLANSLAQNQPKGSSPSAQTQQFITTLIQQSINSARTATIIAPLTSVNWQNLSSVYRSLIGFGQNAEAFAVASNQQAIALDPNNPQEYVNLGGIYYQLQAWDNAQRQFQTAIALKSDFANAYYNLGHTLEQKGDFDNALTAYQTVKNLVSADKANVKVVDADIDALKQKAGAAKAQAPQATAKEGENQPPLGLNTSETQLPSQKNQVEIPPPPATSSATKK